MVTQTKALVFVGFLLAALIYGLWMIYYLGRMNAKQARSTEESSKKVRGDIIGKSLFVLPPSHSQPQAAIESEAESTHENQDIFAVDNVPQHPRQIPLEELDEVFGYAPEGVANEPLDIEEPLFVKQFPDDDAGSDDWMNEPDDQYDDEYPPIRAKVYAQGVSFQQMSDAYRTVVQNNQLTDQQKEETGQILLGMEGNDIYKTLSDHPEGKDKIGVFVDAYLSAYQKRVAIQNGEDPLPETSFPSGFDIRDYENQNL